MIFISQNAISSDSDGDSGEIWKTDRNPMNSLEYGEIQRILLSDAMLPAPKLFSDEFRIKKKERKKKFFRFCRIYCSLFARITVKGI